MSNIPEEAADATPKFPLATTAGMTFMRGTEGILAFLILLVRGPLALAVRPLFQHIVVAGSDAVRTFVGFRIRVAVPTEGVAPEGAEFVTAEKIKGAFPDLVFAKLDSQRGSLVIGTSLTDRPEDIMRDGVEAFEGGLLIGGFYAQVIDFLKANAFGDLVVDEAALAGLLREQILSVLPEFTPRDDAKPITVESYADAVDSVSEFLTPNLFDAPAEAVAGLAITGGANKELADGEEVVTD